MRKPADGEALAAAHARIQPIRLDVCDAASVAAAAAEVRGEVGDTGLDGLVNNAGVALIAPLVRLNFAYLITGAVRLRVSSHLNPKPNDMLGPAGANAGGGICARVRRQRDGAAESHAAVLAAAAHRQGAYRQHGLTGASPG